MLPAVNKQARYLLIKCLFLGLLFPTQSLRAFDLAEIKQSGVLRHIAMPNANFVTYYNDNGENRAGGLDVELIQGFATHIGVKYEFVIAQRGTALDLLTGQQASFVDGQVALGNSVAIQGDLVATGLTVLKWREQFVDYSTAYFPSAVWLVARVDSVLKPVIPSGDIHIDIAMVKSKLKGHSVLTMENTALDPYLYGLFSTGANIIVPKKDLKFNELIPAIVHKEAESTLLDLADTMIALDKWPGEVKVIGPISAEQTMAVAFRKSSPELKKVFNLYIKSIIKDGTYQRFIQQYYPIVLHYYGDFFSLLEESH